MAGSWKRLAHTELSSASDTVSSGTIANCKSLRVIIHAIKGSDAIGLGLEFNDDTTSTNYAYRRAEDWGSQSSVASDDEIFVDTLGSSGSGSLWYGVIDIVNIANKEKLIFAHWNLMRHGTGASNPPTAKTMQGKWKNNSDAITSIRFTKGDGYTGNFASGSSITVYGADSDTAVEKLQTNTIFEESDTGKHYIWSGSAWTEVA